MDTAGWTRWTAQFTEDDSRPARPKILIVGGPDVDLRIDLMKVLSQHFSIAAAGSVASLGERFAKSGLSYHYYPLRDGFSPLWDAVSVSALVHLFKQLRPDIVHAFATKPCVWARLAARRAGVPVVIGTLPGLGTLYVRQNATARLLRACYVPLQRAASHSSDLTILQNHHDAEEMVRAGVVPPTRAKIIVGSGVRTDLFDAHNVSRDQRSAIRAELGAPDGAVVVTMISRVTRSKGVLDLAEAAKILRSRGVSAHFVLVGPRWRIGEDRLSDQEMATVEEIVQYLGARADIPQILAASDVFVLPSYYREGVPRVLMEAAAMALPLVATKMPGCTEVVKDGVNGFIVEPRDPAALAAALQRLVESPILRRDFGQESRKLALERFDLTVVARQTCELYIRLLIEAGITSSPNAKAKGPKVPVFQ